jgi:hypothetical protein
MSTDKPRVIKDFEKLDEQIQEQIKLTYPRGFSKNLISFTNRDGNKVSALPFETDDRYYLVRMTVQEARKIILQDDDYDEDGRLRKSIREDYEDKYAELDYLADDDEEEALEIPDDGQAPDDFEEDDEA